MAEKAGTEEKREKQTDTSPNTDHQALEPNEFEKVKAEPAKKQTKHTLAYLGIGRTILSMSPNMSCFDRRSAMRAR